MRCDRSPSRLSPVLNAPLTPGWRQGNSYASMDSLCVREKPSFSIALHEMGATAIPGLHLPQ